VTPASRLAVRARAPLLVPSHRGLLVAALVVTRLGDVLVTYHGLGVGLVEVNPVAVAAMDALGVVPGLLAVSAAVVVGIVAAGETALRLLDPPRSRRPVVRALWYGGPALLWAGVCVYNAVLVLRVT